MSMYHLYVKSSLLVGYFVQGPVSRVIKTTVKMRWSFLLMCFVASLVCPSIASHRTCQLWARSEHVNMSRTIESTAKCDVHAVIRFIYSEQATRNVVIRHCSSSWQCSAAHCSCNKEAPAAFSMGSVWSPPYSPDVAPSDFHLFSSYETVSKRTTFSHR